MPMRSELIAAHRSIEEVRQIIGADRLIFQDLDAMVEAINDTKHSRVTGFDCSVFNGCYVAGNIDDAYFESQKARRQR